MTTLGQQDRLLQEFRNVSHSRMQMIFETGILSLIKNSPDLPHFGLRPNEEARLRLALGYPLFEDVGMIEGRTILELEADDVTWPHDAKLLKVCGYPIAPGTRSRDVRIARLSMRMLLEDIHSGLQSAELGYLTLPELFLACHAIETGKLELERAWCFLEYQDHSRVMLTCITWNEASIRLSMFDALKRLPRRLSDTQELNWVREGDSFFLPA